MWRENSARTRLVELLITGADVLHIAQPLKNWFTSTWSGTVPHSVLRAPLEEEEQEKEEVRRSGA